MNRKPLFVVAVLLLLSPSVPGRADPVDDFVQAQMKKQRIPGLSIAVVEDGKVIMAQGYGLANVELHVPATKDTVYSSGSVGKQFTATCVMQLVEDGKIGLDDKVSKYLDGTPDTWKDITVRHLLTHTSGIKNYSPLTLNFRKDYTDAELLKIATRLPLDFTPPGAQWKYSNTGYVLLGILIKQVSGKFYGDLLKERVFGPLGMGTARVYSEADIIPNRAKGYRLLSGELKNDEYVSPTLNQTADGSLVFSVLDMARWDAGLYTEKILKKSSLEQMWTPVKLNDGSTYPYGFGWALLDYRGHQNISHGGAWLGFTTSIWRLVDDKLTVIVLTNRAGTDPDTIARGVAGFYRPVLLLPGFLKEQPDPDPKLTETLTQFLTAVGEGMTESPLLTPGQRTALTKMGPGARGRLTGQLREVTRLTFLRRDDLGERPVDRQGSRVSRIGIYRITGGKATHYVTFYLTAEDKVAAFNVESE
jgi:CubicO group peptidase (beta-lactamase class C family)